MEPVLRASGLGRRYGRHWVLHQVDLTTQAGEAVAVVGANGAGKSTLLSILATLLRPDTGEVRLFGQDALKRPQAARPRLGYVGHQTLLNDALTARENLAYYADLYAIANPQTVIDQRLSQARLTDRGEDRVDGYSRGMRQRLALARALLHDPDLLLMDEPFSGLDARAATDLASFLASQRTADRSMVVVTHQLGRVHDWCDRVVVLHQGAVVESLPAAARSPAEWSARLSEIAEAAP